MQLSDYVLEKMGFIPVSPSRRLIATFHSTHVYQIAGFTFDELSLEPMRDNLDGISYAIAAGCSVNAICRKLGYGDFVESEENWMDEHACTPPYLVVHLAQSSPHEALVDRIRNEHDSVQTYRCFDTAKAQLRETADRVLPPLLSAMACSFSKYPTPVRFLPKDIASFGVLDDGTVLQDICISNSATLSVSSKSTTAEIENGLKSGLIIATSFNPKVAKLFYLALYDDDPLKKFLYFFMSIEIKTHATFNKIDHEEHISTLISPPSRLAENTYALFNSPRSTCKSLRDRFIWCTVCIWPQLNDDDVNDFLQIKRTRDEIAHGAISTPTSTIVSKAEQLAIKLHLNGI